LLTELLVNVIRENYRNTTFNKLQQQDVSPIINSSRHGLCRSQMINYIHRQPKMLPRIIIETGGHTRSPTLSQGNRDLAPPLPHTKQTIIQKTIISLRWWVQFQIYTEFHFL